MTGFCVAVSVGFLCLKNRGLQADPGAYNLREEHLVMSRPHGVTESGWLRGDREVH